MKKIIVVKFWLQSIVVFTDFAFHLTGRQTFCSKSGKCISIFEIDVRFDIEHTVNTKAGNRVSLSSERLQA